MDIASIGGIVVALIGILAGMMLEGGSLTQIAQPAAALIVIGGTAGAIMLQFEFVTLRIALREIIQVFRDQPLDDEDALAQLLGFAHQARRHGILSLDTHLDGIADPFLKQTLMLAIDGTEPAELNKMMQLELDKLAEAEEKIPAVFEAAGGYAPTVGILGAVLGLIQVMKNLDNIAEVGRGIATAFVATIYGVALANLVCLPVAGKLRQRQRQRERTREMILEGILSILEDRNPRMVEIKLRTYLSSPKDSLSSGKPAVAQPEEAVA